MSAGTQICARFDTEVSIKKKRICVKWMREKHIYDE